jgi:hypothetical protein
MKNMMRYKSRLCTCLLLLCLIFVQSCRKDAINTIDAEPANQKQQLIKEETIQKWFATNPIVETLSPDWTKARQAVIEGKNVVRVPLLNQDKLSSLAPKMGLNIDPKSNLANRGAKISVADPSDPNNPPPPPNPNYFTQHPPELFLIQESTSGKLYSYLLNFVPTNPTQGFGQNGLWTGKLLEWNCTGDTILVQEVLQSQVIDRYGIAPQFGNNNPVESIREQNLTLNIKDKRVSSIWTWLGQAISNIWQGINWVGFHIGIPGAWIENPTVNGGGRIIRTWGLSWLTGEGGNSSGDDDYDNGGGYYMGAGPSIYSSYASGLQAPGGGNNSGEPYEWNQYPSSGSTPHGPNPGNIPVYSVSLSALMNYLDLTVDEINFLHTQETNDQNNSIAKALENYLLMNGLTPENIEFADWAVGYSTDFPEVDINALITNNNIPNSTINLPNLDVSELSNYPTFKNLVENLPSFLTSYPNILKALEATTGFSAKKIMQLMQPGKGPKVVVIINLKDTKGNNITGHYDKITKTLQIDNDYVNDLSLANTPTKYQAIGLILTISTLHEFVHYGTNENSLIPVIANRLRNPDYEPGWDFEGNIQPPNAPGYVQPSNVKEWLKYYKIKPKN